MSGTTNLSRAERLKRRRRLRRRGSLLPLFVAVIVLATAGTALAFWTGAFNGSAKASAGIVGTAVKPTFAVSGRDVTLSWGPTANASAYTVARSNVNPQSLPTVLHGSCASSVAGLSCVDASVTEGGTAATNWTYSEAGTLQQWIGNASPASGTVVVPGPTISLGTTSFSASGGATTASVANFFDSESISYCLDTSNSGCAGGTLLGTDTVPTSGGSTTPKAITIPALAAGAHSVFAVGSLGSAPSQTITVTGTAPTITSASTKTFTAGTAGAFPVTTTGSPAATLSESGALPNGVTFTDNGNGTATLAGTPSYGTAFTYPITITASNGVSPDATQSFTLVVNPAVTTPPGSYSVVVPSGYSSVNFTSCGGGGGGGAAANGAGGTGGQAECQTGTIAVPAAGATFTVVVGGGGGGATVNAGGVAGSGGGGAGGGTNTGGGGGGGGGATVIKAGSTLVQVAGGGAGGSGGGGRSGSGGGGAGASGGDAADAANTAAGSSGTNGTAGTGANGHGNGGGAGNPGTTSANGTGGSGGTFTSGGAGNSGTPGSGTSPATGGAGGTINGSTGNGNGGAGGGGGGGNFAGGGGGEGGFGSGTNNGGGSGGSGGGGSTFDNAVAGNFKASVVSHIKGATANAGATGSAGSVSIWGPIGSITAPTAGSTLTGTAAVSASVTLTAPSTSATVQFLASVNGGAFNSIGSDSTSPYSISWNTTGVNGTVQIDATVTDNGGAVYTTAATTVTVNGGLAFTSPGLQTFTVPAGMTHIGFTLYGGGGSEPNLGTAGGNGGEVSGTITLPSNLSGVVLTVVVGGGGSGSGTGGISGTGCATGGTGGSGTFGGGGGGGATCLYSVSSSPIAIAGGGGAGGSAVGGAGTGGAAANPGTSVVNNGGTGSSHGVGGGGGATITSNPSFPFSVSFTVGGGGSGDASGTAGGTGTSGNSGGTGGSSCASGGGGGGGYASGGGGGAGSFTGCNSGGGGGGSGYSGGTSGFPITTVSSVTNDLVHGLGATSNNTSGSSGYASFVFTP